MWFSSCRLIASALAVLLVVGCSATAAPSYQRQDSSSGAPPVGASRSGELRANLREIGPIPSEEATREISKIPLIPARKPFDFALVGVNVIPMSRPGILRDQTIIVRNGTIAALGPRSSTRIPKGVVQTNWAGRYVIPGLADMHAHLESLPQSLPFHIANGVTTIRSMNGKPLYLDWRRREASGEILGPRIFTTGPILDGVAGPGRVVVATADEARDEVRRQADAGYDGIKTYTWLSQAAYMAALQEAKRQKLFVTGHVPDAIGVRAAVAAGQDEIAHNNELRQAFLIGYDPKRVFAEYKINDSAVPEIVSLLKQHDVSVNTTLVVLNAVGRLTANPDLFLARPEFQNAPPFFKEAAASQKNNWPKLFRSQYINGSVIPFFNKRLTLALQKGGVRLVLGTDAAAPGTGLIWGTSVHEELRLLVDAGLTPFQALATATINPAQEVGETGKWGSLERGAIADFVILEANPLNDISATRGILAVSHRGQYYDRRILDGFMQWVRLSYNSK